MAPVNSVFPDNSTWTIPFSFTPSSCHDLGDCRSLSDIVWSCVVVVFMCTWIAIHPNVPSSEESSMHSVIQQLEMMAVALIAPELIILWAMRQWVVAKEIAQKYKAHEWTMTHGFLALMGGFVLYDDSGPKGVLTYKGEKEEKQARIYDSQCNSEVELPLLDSYVEDGSITILKKEITRSTSDALGKLITVIQVGWFIIQCVARAIEGLALTELEVVTLGFAVLNFVTYAVWWHKPLNLKTPFPVHRHGGNRRLSTNPLADTGEGYRKRRRALSDLALGIPRAYKHATTETSQTLRKLKFKADHPNLKFLIPFLYPLHLLHELIYHSVHVFGPHRPREHIFHSKFCVPTFYTGLSEDPLGLSLAVYFIAVILGAVHLTAWNFQFPTRPEQMLWRGTALMVTCGPVFAALSQVIMRHVCVRGEAETRESKTGGSETSGCGDGEKYSFLNCLRIVVGIMVSIQAVFYVLCRVSLLVQAVVLLRALPPSAYQTVQWVELVPHI